jgi:hypothetical protein
VVLRLRSFSSSSSLWLDELELACGACGVVDFWRREEEEDECLRLFVPLLKPGDWLREGAALGRLAEDRERL